MHVIRRQTVEVELPAVEQAFGVQLRVSRLVQERLTPALGHLFDRLVGPDYLLRLGRLELRVEVSDLAAFEEQVLAKVLHALQAELPPRTDDLKVVEISSGGFSPLKTPGRNFNEAALDLDAPSVVPVGEAAFEAFVFFLQLGHLPWWASFDSFAAFTGAVRAFLQADNPGRWGSSLRQLLQTEGVAERLAYQFPEEMLPEVVRYAAGVRAAELFRKAGEVWAAALRKVPMPPAQGEKIGQGVRLILLRGFLAPSVSVSDMLQRVRIFLPPKITEIPDLPQVLEEAWSEAGWPETPDQKLNKLAPEAILPAKSAPEEPLEPEATETKEGLYVPNAGLVLLTPFLLTFLQSGGLAEAHTLLRHLEAVHWLQYLVTGQTRTPEPELLLNKLLCGLPFATPVPAEIVMPPKGQLEANQVLEAVIRHWSALKSTSPAGLRESFLQRAGRLTRKTDGDWLLQVEQKSYDMLLDSLPWSFSLVKLPWMPQALWVEWT